MPRVYKRKTWRDYEAEYGINLEQMYYMRVGGATIDDIAGSAISSTLAVKILRDWIREHGKDDSILNRNYKYTVKIIDEVKCVDQGKVRALRNAGWKIYDIAVDCHCTERCVEEILNVTG